MPLKIIFPMRSHFRYDRAPIFSPTVKCADSWGSDLQIRVRLPAGHLMPRKPSRRCVIEDPLQQVWTSPVGEELSKIPPPAAPREGPELFFSCNRKKMSGLPLDSGAQGPNPQKFLSRYVSENGDTTHYSFKGGYDKFCSTGKWCFPDDAQTQRDLALVIEHLYERAEKDEAREFAYLIELKTPHCKFVQDLDIRAGKSFDVTLFLCEQAKILHDFFPDQDLTCAVYNSSGFSKKRQEPKLSYHLAWNVVVDERRAMAIYRASVGAFASAEEGSVPCALQETLLAMHEDNSWPNVIDDTVHKKNGVRMPYCDKFEGRGKAGVGERRPAVAGGEYRFCFDEGCVCEVVHSPSDLPVHEWILKGTLRTAESMTEPFIAQEVPETPLPTVLAADMSIDYGTLPATWFAVVRDNYLRCVDAIRQEFPGIEIRKASCSTTLRGVVVHFNPTKSDVSKTCPFKGSVHASNNIYFTWTLPSNHVTVRCHDKNCARQERRVASLGPADVPECEVPVRGKTLPLTTFQRFASEGERGLAELVAHVLEGEVVWTGRKWYFYTPREGIWETKLDEKLLGVEYCALREAIDGAAVHLGEGVDALRESVGKVAKRKSIREDLRDILCDPRFETLLDQGVNAISCANGVVDLKTGALRPRAKEDYCTFYCDCEYAGLDSPTPTPEHFIRELMLDDEEMCVYLQTILGYALCGVNPKQGQRFFIFYGPTENGKSKLLKILSNLLGPYCKAMEGGTLQMHTKNVNAATPATRMLCPPVRIAFQDEQASNVSLNNSLIKEMTGGNVITARYLHENPIQYTPTFCPFLITDAQPACHAEQSLKRRVRYVRFDAKFKDEESFDAANPNHRRKIEDIEKRFSEAGAKAQLLTWLVKGAVKFHSYGSFSKVPQPAAVEEATEDFIAENDVIADFLAQCDISDSGAFSPLIDIHRAFEAVMEQPINRSDLSNLLRAKGYRYTQASKGENRGKRGFLGISLP